MNFKKKFARLYKMANREYRNGGSDTMAAYFQGHLDAIKGITASGDAPNFEAYDKMHRLCVKFQKRRYE